MTDKPQQPDDRQPEDPSKPDAVSADSSATEEDAGPDTTGDRSAPASGEAPVASEKRADSGRSPPAKKARNWSAFFLVLLLLASVGGLAYYQWLHQQNFQDMVAEVNEQLEQQSSQLRDVSQSVDRVAQEAQQALQRAAQTAEQREQQTRQLEREVEQQTSRLEQQVEQQTRQLEEQVRGLRQQVQAISTTTTEDWKLAEAYYLTRLAGQRLLMERDTGSALALLQAADRIVRNYPDPDLYPVRQALAEDIAALRTAGSVDREGLYLQISALSRQVAELRVPDPTDYQPQSRERAGPDSESDQAQAGDEASGIWESIQRSFSRAMEKLEDFVRVTRHNEPLQPLIAPDQQLYLRSSLQTALDTAQLALLREQPAIYETSLEKAESILTELYAESDQRSRILSELEELKNTNIVQSLPDVSDSQEALGDYLQQRHRLAPDNGQAPQGEEREVQ